MIAAQATLPNLVQRTRSNHSLEHATVALLLQHMGPALRVLGRSTPHGFYLYGDLPTDLVQQFAHEALARLKGGESELAISPFCGTNYATAGVLAGLGALIAVGDRNRWERLPRVLLASVVGTLVGFSLGREVQRHVTTSPNVTGLHVVRIDCVSDAPRTHYVETSWAA